MQDSKGFLWFGTRYGLNRFDGYTFRVYHHAPDDPASISNDEISSLVEDADGGIWVGTKSGLDLFNRTTNLFHHVQFRSVDGGTLHDPTVVHLLFDGRGVLWIGTDDGVFCLHSGTSVAVEVPVPDWRRSSPKIVYCMYLHDDGTVLISMGTLMLQGQSTPGTASVRPYSTIGNGARAVIKWDEHTLLLGNVGDTTLVICDLSSRQNHPASLALPGRSAAVWFATFLRTSAGAVLGCANSGLLVLDSFAWKGRRSVCIGRVLVSGTTICAVEDHQGQLWVGTTNGIVVLASGRQVFTAGLLFDGASDHWFENTVRSFYSDSTGAVYAGSVYGLHELRPASRFISMCPSHAAPRWDHVYKDAVNAVYKEQDGSMLLCGPGLLRLRRGETRAVQLLRGGPQFLGFWCMVRERPGVMWAGTTRAGIYVLDGSYRQLINHMHDPRDPGSLSHNSIHAMLRDRRGWIWIGTNGGLDRWDPTDSTFVHYRHDSANPRSIGNDRVWVLMEDSKENLWAGTYGGGLARYRPESDDFIRITEADGLPSNAVFGIVEDGRGRLWISTEAGLVCYNPGDRSWRSINEPHVKQLRDFGFHAYHRTAAGEMLFGGSWGYIRFHPDSVEYNPRRPRLMISGVRLFEKTLRPELSDGDTLEVAYADRMLAFEFAALDYVDPARNRYAYKLDGFTPDWIALGTRREAVFTNLDPGTYTLRVRGSNNDGVWNMTGLAVVLVVHPPVHMTWWFRAVSALFLLGALFSIARTRIHSIHRRERMERRLVESELQSLRLQMNPHFIFNSLNAVQSFMLTAGYSQANAYLTKFARLIRNILEHSRASTVCIGDEIDFLAAYVELEQLRFSNRFRFELTVDPGVNREVRIPSMLVQPHVENAIRHGLAHLQGGGRLLLRFVSDGAHVTITVEDNGIGRARAAVIHAARGSSHTSLGISVTEERLAILHAHGFPHARLHIEDLTGDDGEAAGTRVTLVVPIMTKEEAPRIREGYS